MPVPKRKTSKSKRDKRRNQKTTAPNLSTCPDCGEAKLPHHACPSCGTYKGRTVISTDDD